MTTCKVPEKGELSKCPIIQASKWIGVALLIVTIAYIFVLFFKFIWKS